MGKNNKKQRSIAQKMIVSLVGGIVVGLIFMMIRQNLLNNGGEATWQTINNILFQDITTADGVKAIGIFYIIGQIFMKGLQAAIVPLVLVSLSLALCSISNSTKLGRIAGKTLLGFFAFYVVGAAVIWFLAPSAQQLFNAPSRIGHIGGFFTGPVPSITLDKIF